MKENEQKERKMHSWSKFEELYSNEQCRSA